MRTIAAAVGLVALLGMPAARAGDNTGSSSQSGSSSSGDAVGGPSIGVSRAGDVRVEATNVSGPAGADVHALAVSPGAVSSLNYVVGPASATSGDASGSNDARVFVGAGTSPSTLADVVGSALS